MVGRRCGRRVVAHAADEAIAVARRRNPREIPPWVIQLALYGGGAFLAWHVVKGAFGVGKKILDVPGNAIARAIVGKSEMRVADGITYILPSGLEFPASQATSLGGAYVSYKGLRYKITESAGSGFYVLERA